MNKSCKSFIISWSILIIASRYFNSNSAGLNFPAKPDVCRVKTSFSLFFLLVLFSVFNVSDVKPELKATENIFFVTLPNVNYISNDSINDSINDLGFEILKTTKEYPGIRAPKITLQIQKYDSSITL